ncbi:MAG TPA: hypothetical protein VJ343_01160 [archaeon]|nr:hypothetical protein [archaeon]
MKRLKSKIIPFLEENSKNRYTERFSEELQKNLDYVEVVGEPPINVPRIKLKKKPWQILSNLIENNSWATHFLSIEDLEIYLEKQKDRFEGSDVIFLPSNIRLYGDGSQLIGRYISQYSVCYVYLMGQDPVGSAIHNFGHSQGLKFGYKNSHPNSECVMRLPIRTRNFCESCRKTIEESFSRHQPESN